jgi:predicted adenine nucleotide alpha hydrolase (AANH) superfamily ATPase
MPFENPVDIIEGSYDPERFFDAVKGLEAEPEGGKRCEKCFELRLESSARLAAARGYDYVTTTLSISPLKNAELLNTIGAKAAEKYGVSWLFSDFKKKEGYKRSIELSREYELYRQNYCGCVFSSRR